MKKLFSFAAVLLFTVSAINAEVLWEENFHKGESVTSVIKAKTSFGSAFPEAQQWFTGYQSPQLQAIEGSLYKQNYTNVQSSTDPNLPTPTIRDKRVDGQKRIVLYFDANKKETDNFVTFTVEPITIAEGTSLVLDVCSPEEAGGDLKGFIVKVNGEEKEIPTITLGEKGITSKVTIALNAGKLTELYLSFKQSSKKKAISSIRLEKEVQTAIDNTTNQSAKAIKLMENGQLIIVRDGVKYNVAGVVIE